LTENMPKNLVQILKVLGIDDHNLQSRTIHWHVKNFSPK
jgi:hypothetical protein